MALPTSNDCSTRQSRRGPKPRRLIKTGVYSIRNTRTGRVYVGSSLDIELRWKQHVSKLKFSRGLDAMQEDWDTYGSKIFDFSVLEETTARGQDLQAAEQRWVDHFLPTGVYNNRLTVSRPNSYELVPDPRSDVVFDETSQRFYFPEGSAVAWIRFVPIKGSEVAS